MIELDILDDNEHNDDFHLEEYFHQFVMVDNQDIFDGKAEIDQRFFANYTGGIFVNLASC